MAKRSIENRARDERNAIPKRAHTKAVKAKINAGLKAFVAEAEVKADNNVVDIVTGSAVAVKANADFDTSIPLSSSIDPATSKKASNLREVVITDEQKAYFNQSVDSKPEDVFASIKQIGREIAGAQWKMHALASVICYRLQRDKGDAVPMLNAFVAACEGANKRYSIIRINALVSWFNDFACVTYDTETKAFLFDKAKYSRLAGEFGNKRELYIAKRMAKPFFMHTPAPEVGTFDLKTELASALERLIKKANTISNMDDNAKKLRYSKVDIDAAALKQAQLMLRKLGNEEVEPKKEVAAA